MGSMAVDITVAVVWTETQAKNNGPAGGTQVRDGLGDTRTDRSGLRGRQPTDIDIFHLWLHRRDALS